VGCLVWQEWLKQSPLHNKGYLNIYKLGMAPKNVNLHQDREWSGSGGSLLTA